MYPHAINSNDAKTSEEKHLLETLSTIWVGHHKAWDKHSQLNPYNVADEDLPTPVFSASSRGIV